MLRMADRFTRVTLASERRNVELLLPSEVPVGALIPSVLELLGAGPDKELRRMGLSPLGGPALDEQKSLEQSNVLDGAILMLTGRADAVPAPVVYDIADHAALMGSKTPGYWKTQGRLWVGGLALVVCATAAYWLLTQPLPVGPQFWVTAACATVLLAVAASLPRRTVVLNPALAAVAVIIAHLHVLTRSDNGLLGVGLVVTSGVLAVLSWHLSNRDFKATATSCAVVVALAACWVVTWVLTPTPREAAAITGTLTIALLGYLPRLALAWAGLNTLDDARAAGQVIATSDVQFRLEQVHRGMASSTAWCAVSVSIAVVILLWHQPVDPWTLPLILVWIIALALRARSFPLTTQRASLLLASVCGFTCIALDLAAHFPHFYWWIGLILLLLGIVTVLPLVTNAPDHFWARLRILADRVETIATLAMFPLVVGLFGVYSSLLTTFQT